MKKLLLIMGFGMLISITMLQSQSLTPQVYASSGSHYTSAAAQLSFTIGEPLTSTYTGATTMVTQGFHQPDKNTAGINENEDFIFNIYPNPTQNYVTISYSDESIKKYTVDLIDQLGQIVATRILTGNNQQIDVSTLAAGNYHLRVTYLQNKSNSFTIIKTTNQ